MDGRQEANRLNGCYDVLTGDLANVADVQGHTGWQEEREGDGDHLSSPLCCNARTRTSSDKTSGRNQTSEFFLEYQKKTGIEILLSLILRTNNTLAQLRCNVVW